MTKLVIGVRKIVVGANLVEGLGERDHRGTAIGHAAGTGGGQIVYSGTAEFKVLWSNYTKIISKTTFERIKCYVWGKKDKV